MRARVRIISVVFFLTPFVYTSSGWAQSLDNSCRNSDSLQMNLYFKFNGAVIDSGYLNNRHALHTLAEIVAKEDFLSRLDSIVVRATSSPEGPSEYNKALAQKRADAVRKFILWKYSFIPKEKISSYGMGENWHEFHELIEKDPKIPNRQKILDILSNPLLNNRVKGIKIEGLGKTYNYLVKNIFPYLRVGTTVVTCHYKKAVIMDTVSQPEPDTLVLNDIEEPVETPVEVPDTIIACKYIRPIALKTNLLFDLATLFNIEVEIPIGKRWSLACEWIFPWWGGLGNISGVSPIPTYSEKYTLQMLSGGLEGRYWFPRSASLEAKSRRWGDSNLLTGWFLGIYAGAGIYDFQFGGDGVQGDFYIMGGISGGYAHPIGKYLHVEYSIGIGYLQTDYKKYEPIDGHKVYIWPDHRQTWIGPTKAKISLIWVPRFKMKKGGFR